MAREQVIDEVANDRVGLVAKFGNDAANQRSTSAVPFEIDRAMKIAGAMDFRPTVRAARLFRPSFDEAKFFLQLRISRDLAAQRSAPGRDDLNHRLHPVVRFNRDATFAILL